MKLALIGYGKMGHAIEEIARGRGHDIVLTIDHHNPGDLTAALLKKADAAIEFTRPEAALNNILACIDAGVPVVSGTTGWLDNMEEARKHCLEKKGAFFYASNYSIGVNIFFEVNRILARIMNTQPQYQTRIEEIHHVHKLDAPSGTAITLAQDVLKEIDRLQKRRDIDLRNEEKPESLSSDELQVLSYRIREVPGTHRVTYNGPDDELMIMHHAHSRRGFAEGAVIAAEWLAGRKGIFGMQDLLKFSC